MKKIAHPRKVWRLEDATAEAFRRTQNWVEYMRVRAQIDKGPVSVSMLDELRPLRILPLA